MFIDYQSLVLDTYEKKKAANTLSPLLVHPSPANIREECLAVCKEGYLMKDEKVLRTFFGKQDNKVGYLKAISEYKEIQKFKPLLNLLKKQTSNPNEKYIELLAWLIDFEPRPYQFGKQYDTSSLDSRSNIGKETAEVEIVEKEIEEDEIEREEEENMEDEESTPVAEPDHSTDKINVPVTDLPIQIHDPVRKPPVALKIKPLVVLPVIAILLSGVYWWFSNRNTGCMAWKGDHYERVPCDSKFGDTLVVGADTFKMNHFKKITRPDTITGYSVGSVWYVKVDGGIEYYTDSGSHPIQREKQLKPLTDYIIIKHIRNNDSLIPFHN